MIKFVFIFAALFLASIATSGCNKTDKPPAIAIEKQTPKAAQPANVPAASQTTTPQAAPKEAEAQNAFSVENVPISNVALGDFPYFNAPEGYKITTNQGKKFDTEYFFIEGKLVPISGDSFKAHIGSFDGSSSAFISPQVREAYSSLMKKVGAVRVPGAPPTREEIDRIGVKAILGNNHGFTFNENRLDKIETYLLRTPTEEIWVQYFIGNESGNIVVIRKKDMTKATITLMDATQMKKDILATGKAILNINFDTDKAILRPEANSLIVEISQLLKNDSSLKLSIEGHTDDVGDAARNKVLATERAQAVVDKLVGMGIATTRLTASGFGASKPIAANDSDINRAKNRRVELVKIQ